MNDNACIMTPYIVYSPLQTTVSYTLRRKVPLKVLTGIAIRRKSQPMLYTGHILQIGLKIFLKLGDLQICAEF